MRYALVLCRNGGIGSNFLRAAMRSPWSHSAVLDTYHGVVYDFTLLHGGGRAWNSADFFRAYPVSECRAIDVPEEKMLDAGLWLTQQVGKPYDWTALLAFVPFMPARDWQEEDAFFCSEHSETFISKFSRPRFRTGAQFISPKHQEMLA